MDNDITSNYWEYKLSNPQKLVQLLEKEIFSLQEAGAREILYKYGVHVPDHELEKVLAILLTETRKTIEKWRAKHIDKIVDKIGNDSEAEQWASINRIKGKRVQSEEEEVTEEEVEWIDA